MLVHVFAVLIVLQFVVVVSHDHLEVPGWSHAHQIRAALGARKLLLATLINSVFPGIAALLAVMFWNRPVASYASTYWLIYCAITVGSAVAMWWWPYVFGAKAETKRLYAAMYEGTLQVLPPRNDHPRPNLLHVCFHVLFAVTLVLAAILRFRSAQ